MNIDEFLGRLKQVRRAQDGWMAECTGHDDSTPSLLVKAGEDGKILLHCYGGCTVEDVVEGAGLVMTDLFPPSPRLLQRSSQDLAPAASIAPVAAWLKKRGFPSAEIRQMFAAPVKDGYAVVFPYRDNEGKLLYRKFRTLGKKSFWRNPSNTKTLLFGLPWLSEVGFERVVVVEGELDAHALRSVGIAEVVSVPDGTGSRLSDELLLPLAPFREVLIASDGDEPGEKLARKLATALGPFRCRRVRFGAACKDANDALKAGWQKPDFETAFAEAPPCSEEASMPGSPRASEPEERLSEEDPDEPVLEPLDLRQRYLVHNDSTCYRRTDRQGNQVIEMLANFNAEVKEEIAFDDGAEIRREFRIAGRLASGEALPDARVQASEFGSLVWVTREWGIRAVVSAGQGTKDHLRTAVQLLSHPRRRTIHRHTGWVKGKGAVPVFLYQGGAVGADDIEVDLPPPLDKFRLPAVVEDLEGAIRLSLRVLECGPLTVTVPLLASAYLAPVASILNPDVTVWLFGPSGSLKSTLSALAQAHFGVVDRKTLSATWTATDNALENRLFILKDVLTVIDDYAPQADARAQSDLDRRAQRILRNVGNRAGRSRLLADLSPRSERPPRGFLLCNGEMIPKGYSIVARLFPVEVDRATLNLLTISDLQRNVERLPHAMRGYLSWLAPQMAKLERTLPEARDALRDRLRESAGHLRQPEAIANLYMGIDLLLQFAEETGAIPPDAAEIYRNEALKALRTGAARHASSLVDIHPAEKFVETLTTLCAQSKVALLDPDSMRGPPDGVEMIGWRRGDLALILPDAVHRRVSIFLRESGDHWAPSLRDLHRDLVARGYALASADGRDAGQWRVGADHKKKRGWIIPTNALGLASILGASNSAPNLGATASHSGGTAPPAISLNFQEESKACLPCPQCLHVLEGEGEPGANVVVKS